MKYFQVLLFLTLTIQIFATEFSIGPENDYKNPNEFYKAAEAQEISLTVGDTISIEAGVYRGVAVLAIWTVDSLLVRGVNGQAHLYAEGEYIIGKGIFVSKGNDITYENIAFYDASVPDKNGAGIRLDGSGLMVRNCLFYNNENGILANDSENGRVVIEHSEFAVGGFGDGFSHNIYINHCASLTIQFCYFHDAAVGHQIKSRADSTVIKFNRIADMEGNSSRLIDISNGGQCLILGNELIQGPNAENNNLIGYGLEGLSNPTPHRLMVIHNTIINQRQASCVFFHTHADTENFYVANNVFAGICNTFNEKEPTLAGNLFRENIDEIAFVNEEEYNFLITAESDAIDVGIELSDEEYRPAFEYVHPLKSKMREVLTLPDAGAHEADIIIATEQHSNERLTYSNPVKDIFFINGNIGNNFQIWDLSGNKVKNGLLKDQFLDLSSLIPGIYIFKLLNEGPIKIVKL